MTIQYRNGKAHSNTVGLSRIPTTDPSCDRYDAGKDISERSCGGCKYCQKVHEQWSRFGEDVDDVVPLAVRTTQTEWCSKYSESDKVTNGCNWSKGFSHMELREEQENDQDLNICSVGKQNLVLVK
jgi:hypothetical protein